MIFQKNVYHWEIVRVHFLGLPVSMLFVDPRDQSWWVALDHKHWGQKLHRSYDEGANWEEIPVPKYPPEAEIRPGKKASLRLIWSFHHGGLDRPGTYYMGTEPGGLFYSSDGGNQFELVESLWHHPSRPEHWFGTGSDYPGIHSIVVDPRDSDHVYIAVSCAGVFETYDGGKSWEPRNEGLIAAYLPNPHVEVGHDPHRLLLCEAQPEVMWQQNHCGIFRSADGANTWKNVTDQTGLADYGFGLAVDEQNPLRAWVIPAVSDAVRVAPDLALTVCVTEDGGKSWQAQRRGLPQENAFDLVFRHAFERTDGLMAFGTTNGNVYLSENDGEVWMQVSSHLTRVNVVAFT